MSRRKFRNAPRTDSLTERSFHEYLFNVAAPLTSRTELLRLIRAGEDTYLELKVKLSNPEKIAQGIIALANTNGGTIVFGVTDQLRIEGVEHPEWVRDELVRICREEVFPPLLPLIDCIAFDSGRRIVTLDIEGKRRPYRTKDGRFYLRIGAEKREATREELSMWLDEIRPLHYENIPVFDASEKDIDDLLLWSFAREFEVFDDKVVYQTGEFLKRDLLLGVGATDEFIPTIAAILLFGKNERVCELIPRASVRLTRYAGKDVNSQIVEDVELKGNLFTIFESAMRLIKRYSDLQDVRQVVRETPENSPVNARPRFHENSIREALTNVLVHRDLAMRDVTTRILLFDHSIEFINPRRTNGFSPPANRAMRYGISQSLYPQTKAIFTNPAYGIEPPNGGLPMILKESRIFSNKKPEIYTSGDEFKLKIYSI